MNENPYSPPEVKSANPSEPLPESALRSARRLLLGGYFGTAITGGLFGLIGGPIGALLGSILSLVWGILWFSLAMLVTGLRNSTGRIVGASSVAGCLTGISSLWLLTPADPASSILLTLLVALLGAAGGFAGALARD